MAIDKLTLAASKSFTKKIALGISSMRVQGTTVYFTIAQTGEEVSVTLPTPSDGKDGVDGKDGSSVTDIDIKEIFNEYHLICTITDADGNDKEIDAGIIPNTKIEIASKDKTGIVKIGDNLDISADGTLSANIGNTVIEISKEEYDKLSEEEKKDKVYYIYDDDDISEISDGKIKLTEDSEAKYINELIDKNTISIDIEKNIIKVIGLDGLEVPIATLNFIKNLDKDIMLYLNSVTNPMTFKGVVADDAALNAISDLQSGDTYIVQSSASNDGKTMTYIYNGTDFVPIAETTIEVRDFTTDPLDLATETTGILPESKIDALIARLADVLAKASYAGSADGIVKQADMLTGLTATITQLNKTVADSHTHTNLTVLNKIVENGVGNKYLADDGTYKEILVISSSQPTDTKQIWIDSTDTTLLILKIYNGTDWVAISGGVSSGTTITVDTEMSNTSTNTVQNKVIKKYIDENAGANGKSAYEVALDEGFVGTEEEWLESLEGDAPTIVENPDNIGDIYKLDIISPDGTTLTTPNLKGSGGAEYFDNPELTIVDVGGLPSGSNIYGQSTKEVLETILYPYVQPVIELTTSPEKLVYDVVSETLTTIKLIANVTRKSNDIASINFYVGTDLAYSVTSNYAKGGVFTFEYIPENPINTTTSFRVVVNDGQTNTEKTIAIKFVGKSYYGILGADVVTPTEDDIKTLNTATKDVKEFTYNNITMTDSKICYAYPKEFEELVSVKDDNGFSYLDSYTKSTLIVDGIDYYVYLLTNSTTLTNYKQIFA